MPPGRPCSLRLPDFRAAYCAPLALGRLSMLVQTVVYQQVWNMPDPPIVLSETQNEILIAIIEKFLVTVKADALMDTLLHEKRRMNNVADVAEAQDVVIIQGFFPSKNRLALTVDLNNVAKKNIHFRMRPKTAT